MAEYIDLDTPLEVKVARGNTYRTYTSTLRELLDVNHIPYTAADVRPVVLCRDCKMASPCSDDREMYCTLNHCYKTTNYFCADGRKKNENPN